MRCFITAILVLFCFALGICQENISFQLNETIEMPGNRIENLKTIDFNNDGILDYAYNDSDYIFIVDGFDNSTLYIFENNGPFNLGDINNDQLLDIAIANHYEGSEDSVYVSIFTSPNYNLETRVAIANEDNNYTVSISGIYLGSLYSTTYVVIGTLHLHSGSAWEEGNYYQWTFNYGEARIYEYNEGGLTLTYTSNNYLGRLPDISYYKYNNIELLLLNSSFYHYWNDWDHNYVNQHRGARLTWVDSALNFHQIWSDGSNAGEYFEIHKIVSNKSNLNDNLSIIFSYNQGYPVNEFRIIGFEYPFQDSLWQISWPLSDYIQYMDNLIYADDKLITFADSIFAINPDNGHIISRSLLEAYQGKYRCSADQENDGIDEYFFTDTQTNQLYVYNLEITTSIDNENSPAPANFQLLNNYPNPFNANTTISYQLNTQSNIRIEIYDILGQKVTTLVNGIKPAGDYQVLWDASDYSSGVYFYKLQTDSYSETKKMVLIK